MSQENVEIVRRYVEALETAIAAYWSDPRPGVAAMEKALEYNSRGEALEAVGLSESRCRTENVELAQQAFDAFNRRDWVRFWR